VIKPGEVTVNEKNKRNSCKSSAFPLIIKIKASVCHKRRGLL
jgi:hypothetical protein